MSLPQLQRYLTLKVRDMREQLNNEGFVEQKINYTARAQYLLAMLLDTIRPSRRHLARYDEVYFISLLL